jgi:signal transduction histidine kinase
MIVDVCKRNIKKKALWILLIVVGVWIEAAIGIEAGYFDFDFGLFFGIKTATAYTINSVQAIGARISIPIGTIIYFFLRKSLSAREEAIAAREAAEAEARAAAEAEAKAKAEAEQAALEEAAVEAESAEEKTEENNEDQ